MVGVLIPVAPWLLLGWNLGLGPLPESGTALRNLTLMVRHLSIISPLESVVQAPNTFLPFYFQNGLEFLSAWVRQVPLLFPVTMPVFALFPIETATRITAIAALLLVPAAIYVVAKLADARIKRLTWIWTGWAALTLTAYAVFILGPWFYQRYAAPLAIVFSVITIVALDRLMERTALRNLTMPIAGAMMLAGFIVLVGRGSYRWLVFGGIPDDGFHRAAIWISDEISPSSRVGVFSAGLIGYYADQPIIALDGKVNGGAREALEAGEMFSFICETKIDYIADWERMTNSLLIRRSREWQDAYLSLVHQVEVQQYNDILIYKVNRDHCDDL
jgi:hypothetical protein